VPRPKRPRVLTVGAPHTPDAIDEWQHGIEAFIAHANLARRGASTLPAARQADRALTAFAEGRYRVRFAGLSPWAAVAGQNILTLVSAAHWHLRLCPICDQWLLAKDARLARCRRPACVREIKRRKRAEQRQARKRLDMGATTRANRD
jgi:hypothetical protein